MENIAIEEFKKLNLRVGEIKLVEDIVDADRLYKVTVDIGEMRVVVAGIKPWYTKEELIGKKVVVIANLAPRTIRGVESHGMILAAANGDRTDLSVLTVDRDIVSGCLIA